MSVLDIDMDFFLSAPCPFAEEGQRPDDSCAEPWSEKAVRDFLENNLGLDRSRPLPGRIFPTHEGALLFWDELAREGELTLPFDVTHVDAHTDLGIAQKGYPFVKMNVLGRPVDKRRDFAQYLDLGQLNEANYLVFAIGARMIHCLENVRNPASKPDLPAEMLTEEGHLKLCSAFPSLFEARYGTEPAVPYREFKDPFAYRAQAPFDFVSLAVSPRYAPQSADFIADVVKEYML